MCAENVLLLVFYTPYGALDTDRFDMPFPSFASLGAATMVSGSGLFFLTPWFNPSEVQCFPVSGYVDENGILPTHCIHGIFNISFGRGVALF